MCVLRVPLWQHELTLALVIILISELQGGHMGSPRECTRILGLAGYRVDHVDWDTDGPRARLRMWLERRGRPERIGLHWPRGTVPALRV